MLDGGDVFLGCGLAGVVWDPPACIGEACIEDIEEFAGDGGELGGFVLEMCDGALACCWVDEALCVVWW